MNFVTEINGLPVIASYSQDNIDNIFLPLLRYLTKLQKDKNRRILVMLAAPCAAGKTTLLEFLKYLSQEHEDISEVINIGIDGFHHYQDYLLSHFTLRNGQKVKMVDIKGAPITFDLPLLTQAINKVAAGEEVAWPQYSRALHNPIENAIKVKGDIVILEGNYLLLKEDGWNELSQYADYTISIRADVDFLKGRLLQRKMQTVNDKDKALQFVEYSDLYNARLILNNMKEADLQLWLKHDGSFTIN